MNVARDDLQVVVGAGLPARLRIVISPQQPAGDGPADVAAAEIERPVETHQRAVRRVEDIGGRRRSFAPAAGPVNQQHGWNADPAVAEIRVVAKQQLELFAFEDFGVFKLLPGLGGIRPSSSASPASTRLAARLRSTRAGLDRGDLAGGSISGTRPGVDAVGRQNGGGNSYSTRIRRAMKSLRAGTSRPAQTSLGVGQAQLR